MEDEWGEPASTDAVKSYKIVDIRDITVAFKPPQPSPVKEASADGTGRPEDAGMKRSHSQEPAVGNNHATEPKKPKLDGAAKSGKGVNKTILSLLRLRSNNKICENSWGFKINVCLLVCIFCFWYGLYECFLMCVLSYFTLLILL